MAGAGYKLFNTGDVLTAAQVNTYLQEQVVMVFNDAASRTTALSGVLAEGMVSYLKSTDAVEVYNGSAWVGVATGDITGVTAGTGLSGGGTSGDVTVSLSTPVSATNGGTAQTTYATGDILYASASNTLSKRTIGSTGQVLTVSGGVPTWATASSGGFTSLASANFPTGASTLTISSIDQSYVDLYLVITGAKTSSNGEILFARFNGVTSASYFVSGHTTSDATLNETSMRFTQGFQSSSTMNVVVRIPNYATTSSKFLYSFGVATSSTGAAVSAYMGGTTTTTAVSSLTIFNNSTNNFTAGSYTLYGVK